MRLQTKLILVFLFLAMIPLAISGSIIVRILDEQVTQQNDIFRNERLEALSHRLDWNLQQVENGLRQGLETFDLTRLDEAERVGVLQILYRQRPYLNAIQLLDSRGQPLGPAVHLRGPIDPDGAYAGHVPIADDELSKLTPSGIIDAARQKGVAWGDPVEVASTKMPQLPLALAFKRDNRIAFMATALLSAADAAGARVALREFSGSGAQESPRVYLLDQNDHILLGVDKAAPKGHQLQVPPPLLQVLRGGGSGQLEFVIDGVSQMVAWYTMSTIGWRVATAQPSDDVYQSVREPKRDIMYWLCVSIVIAVVFGAYFSRTLSTPIRQLADGVLQVARGNLDARVRVRTRDEIGELGETFNYMAGELKAQKAEIERQSEEIRTWNRELQARVEARTRELKEAQGYLIHTQKLAAVAELGSGVAHELNNPLTAILGFIQILIARGTKLGPDGNPVEDQDLKILRRIEEQTQRCRDIVHHLLRFSQEQVDRGAYDSVDLAEVVSTVLKLFEGSFSSRKIQVDNRLELGRLMSWGNRAQLLQAFLQLFSAIRSVLSSGQSLVIDSRSDSSEIRLLVRGPLRGLEGPGSDPFQGRTSQDQAMAQGLGLWLARQIFQEHQGGLQVEPVGDDASSNATLAIALPARALGRAGVLEGGASAGAVARGGARP
jgi:signal transduction histidine kinase